MDEINELVARLRDDGYSAESGAFTVMREAADTIESQEKKIAELEREIAGYKTLTMQLAKAEESACIEAFYADEDRKKAETTLSEAIGHADAMDDELDARRSEWKQFEEPHAAYGYSDYLSSIAEAAVRTASELTTAYRQWKGEKL